jgi:hypothetical protein
MVVNSKPINQAWAHCTEHDYHKLEGLSGFLRLLDPGSWMLVWDLSEAYFHIMVDYTLSLYFGIKVKNPLTLEWEYMRYVVLPFGWKRSMYFMNKLMAILKRRWRTEFNTLVWSHVDDFALVATSFSEATSARDSFIGPDLEACGVVREPSKGHWDSPTQSAIIYGLRIDSVGPLGYGLVTIPEEKLPSLQAVMQQILDSDQKWISCRQMSRASSKIISVKEAFHPARPWCVPFLKAIAKADPLPWEWDKKSILVDSEMIEHATFLLEALPLRRGVPIWHPKSFLMLTYDAASLFGWGANLWTSPEASSPIASAGEAWYDDMVDKHINDKEAFAFLQALHSFKDLLKSKACLPLGDSTTAVSSFKDWKGSRNSPFRNKLVKQAYLFASEHEITLVGHGHLPGQYNDEADYESRYVDQADWEISPAAWEMVEKAFGPHTWDRFASQGNSKCPRYTSRRFQPECLWPDSFLQPWEPHHNNFVCCPESLLFPALQWIDEQSVEATVIAPSHSAKWQPLLAAMETSSLLLPPPQQSFIPGPSGHVEPWKLRWSLKVGQARSSLQQSTYRAVRVKGRGTPHYHSPQW